MHDIFTLNRYLICNLLFEFCRLRYQSLWREMCVTDCAKSTEFKHSLNVIKIRP